MCVEKRLVFTSNTIFKRFNPSRELTLVKIAVLANIGILREKGIDLTQSYDKAHTPTENPKSNAATQKRHQKLRLHND